MPSRRYGPARQADSRKITVSADGTGVVSHVGSLLLTRALQVTGLAVALALGGDCLPVVAMPRSQSEVFVPAASTCAASPCRRLSRPPGGVTPATCDYSRHFGTVGLAAPAGHPEFCTDVVGVFPAARKPVQRDMGQDIAIEAGLTIEAIMLNGLSCEVVISYTIVKGVTFLWSPGRGDSIECPCKMTCAVLDIDVMTSDRPPPSY